MWQTFAQLHNTTNTIQAGINPVALAADAFTNQIYVVNSASNNLTIINGASNATTTVSDPSATTPVALAINPVTNTVYAANSGSGNVTVVNADINLLATTLSTSSNPVAVAINAVTNKIYVVNSTSSTVTAIDGTTNTAIATINVGTNPDAIAINAFTNRMYVANHDSNTLTVIDGSNNAVVTTLNTGINPTAVAVNPLINAVYVANNGNGSVTVIDGASNTVTTTVTAGTAPVALVADSTTGQVYVANSGSDNVTVFDPAASYSITVTDFAASRPAAIAVDSLTQKIYVANSFSDNVTVIDGLTDLVVSTVRVGSNPTALDLNPNSDRVYVTNTGSNTVSVIDGTVLAVIATVTAGTAPSAVSANPTLNRIYVANHGNGSTDLGSVTVIDGASNIAVTVTDANANQPSALAANPVTSEVYVANNLSSNTTVIAAEQLQANPITTSIAPFSGNQTSDETPSFNFSASNGLNAAPIDELLFQLDTWQGPWIQAGPTSPGNFMGNSPRLLPGLHTLYAYATEGEEGSATVAGPQSSPLIGNIATYDFLVATQLADLVPPSLGFGNQQVGTQSPPQTVTLANPGSARLTFNYSLGGDFLEGSGDTCSSLGGHLAANSSCIIFVVFKPSSPGNENATLTVTDDANNILESTQSVALTGTGTTTSYTLNVADEGSGSGTVMSTPAGISCPPTCAANFSAGTSVRLTASPNAGSTFVGWSGACSGTGACTVTMNSNQAVTATFKLTAVTACTGNTANWIGGASGTWSSASNWSTDEVPNGSNVNVCINDGSQTPSQVTLDVSVSVGTLYIDGGSSLIISNNQQLLAFGNISNAGQIIVSAAGNNTFLTMGAGVSLTGGGSITLVKGGNGTAAIATSGGAQTLTNVDNTLQGTGVIGWNGLIVVNQAGGIMNANTPSTGTLTLNPSSMTNQGLLEAAAGGTLPLQSNFNNAGGRILASGSGSTVQFVSGTVQGGILATASGGTLTTPSNDSFTLDGSSQGILTIAGTYVGSNNSTTLLTGAINNTGAIQVSAAGNNTFLTMSGGVSLTGAGTVTLSTSGNGTAALATAGGNQTLTNVSNTIQGFGTVGYNGLIVVNQAGGIINANTSGNVALSLNPPSLTNQGLLEASGGGTLNLQNTYFNASGKILATGSNSTVQFISGTVQGGTLTGASGGILTTPANDVFTLDGANTGPLTIAGTYVVANNATALLTGTINNTGAIQVNALGNNTFLTMSGGVSFTGGGSVTLTKGGNGTAALATGGGNQTLINVNNTLQGAGIIGYNGLTVVNQGTIDANLPAQGTLTLNPNGLTNEGLLEATAGATLQLNTTTFNNTGGTILASGTSSNVQFVNGAVIQSGTVSTSGGGSLGVAGGSVLTLDGSSHGPLTIAGTYTGNNGSTTFLTGTINNTGVIQVAAAGNNTFLGIAAAVSLIGNGVVTLSTGGNGTAAIETAGGDQTLTNVDNTLQGFGIIGYNGLSVINQGTINANVAATTLTLNPGGFTNQGLLEATNGGTLALSGSTISNRTGTIQVNGGTSSVQFVNGVTIQGGTLAGVNNGILTNPSGNTMTLDGSTVGPLTIAGTYAVANNSITNLQGTINNTGAIQVNALGNNTFLTMVGPVSLGGGGTVTLIKGGGNGTAAIATAGGAQTLTNVNNTLQGTGIIGWNGLNVVNQASGIINANMPSTGTLLVNTSSTTNQGLLEATAGGTLGLQNIVNNLGGRILASGTGSTVQFISGLVQGGTLATASNGILTTPANDVYSLDGSSQGMLTIAGTYVGSNNSTTFLNGTINNTGTIQVSAIGNNTFLTLSGGVNLTGAGTVTLSTSGNGTAALATSGGQQLLTNVNNTLQGFGIIGYNGLEVTNQGIINANVSGATLTLNPSVFTNQGLLEATSGGILALSGSVISNRTGTIQVNGATSSVQFVNNAIIQGGAMAGINNGILTIPSGNAITLDGSTLGQLTIAGTYAVSNNSTTFLVGTIKNTGAIQVNAVGNNTFLTMTGGVSLTGGGSVTLSTSGNGTAALATAGGSQVLTNVNNTLQGFGVIGWNGLQVINQGTINANVSAKTLTLNPNAFTNQGMLEATVGGILALSGSTISNPSGTIEVNGATSSVQFVNNATIQGGTLAGINNGILTIPSGNAITLDGNAQGALTIAGTYAVSNNSTTNLLGTINNTGAIQVNAAGNNTFLSMAGGVSLTGGGTVTLTTTGNGTAAVATSNGNQTLTNVSNILQGTGVIGWNGLNVANQGTINANVASSLVLNPSVFTNQGLIEATGLGMLQVSTSVANAGGSIVANGATAAVQFANGLTIQGGTVNGISGGFVGSFSGNTLTLDGTANPVSIGHGNSYTIGDNSTTIIQGTINNGGTMLLDSTESSTVLSAPNGVTLTGSGAILMSNGRNLITSPSLINNGNTIVDSVTLNAVAYSQTTGKLQVTTTGTASIGTFNLDGVAQIDGVLTDNLGMSVAGGGTLSGNGIVFANVSTSGSTQAGDVPNPGILSLSGDGTGNYTQASSGNYNVVIGGLAAGTQYSQMNTTATATLAGTLNVTLVNNFTPVAGNQFVILTAASLGGQFTRTNLPPLPPNLSWVVNYSSTQVVLSVMAASQNFTLTVTTLGTGNGTVFDSLQQINCTDTAGVQSGTCSASYVAGTTVSLTAVPVEPTTFGGWGGACSGFESCSVLMNSNQSVTASFVPPAVTIDVPFTCPGGVFPCQNVTAPPAVFNCPSGKDPCPDPNAHSLALTAAQVNTAFTMTVAATEVPMSQADGDCQFGQIPSTDFDCRFTSFFPFETLGNGDVIVPACDAYSNGNCVFYSVFFGSRGIEPPLSDYNGPISWSIAWNNISFLPNPNFPYQINNPRLYDDPDYEASIITPYGTDCTVPMLINGNPTDPPIFCQFVFDITTYFDPNQPPDAGIGGKTKQFNDVVVAFPLTIAAPNLSVTKTADQTVVNAGSPIGYTITMSNSPAAGTGTASNAILNDPLPVGANINWTISPPYTGQGTCAITGLVNKQSLTCALGSVSPAISTSVHVMSSNSSAGTYVNTATLSAQNNPPQTSSATIQVVNGSGPIATVTPSKLDFGKLYLWSPGEDFVTLANTGNAAMQISSIKISLPGNDLNDFFAQSYCPTTLQAGKSCKITIVCFANASHAHPTATLAISDNAPGSPQLVPLSATIVNSGATLLPEFASFGNQKVGTTSPPKTLTLTNTGTTSLTVSKVTIGGEFAIESGTTCSNGTTLKPNAQCVVKASFKPKGKGKRTCTVAVYDNALNHRQQTFLTGTGD
jgi:YVTN family beta-propeller protein